MIWEGVSSGCGRMKATITKDILREVGSMTDKPRRAQTEEQVKGH